MSRLWLLFLTSGCAASSGAGAGSTHSDAGVLSADVSSVCSGVVCGSDPCVKTQCKLNSGVCDTIEVLPDGTPCTTTCIESGICTKHICTPVVAVANGTPCDSGEPCLQGATCAAGDCSTSAAKEKCDDLDPCTLDACDRHSGACTNALAEGCGAACATDGDCPGSGPCFRQACSAGHCKIKLVSDPCTDGDACTTGDRCVAGGCLPTSTKSCDDGNRCTVDACSPESGLCAHTPSSLACDDDNVCTVSDVCDSGNCHGKPLTGTHCDDGNKCTSGELCGAGKCISGIAIPCDDKNPCTKDSCLMASGECLHQQIPQCP